LKKSIALLLVLVLLLTAAFAGCKKNSDGDDVSVAESGLQDADTEIILDEVEVTDESGEVVTNEDGSAKTEDVAIEVDRKNKKAYVLNAEGDRTKEVDYKKYAGDEDDTTKKKKDDDKESTTKKEEKTTESTTAEPEKEAGTTSPELTTKGTYTPTPSVKDSGEPVIFSSEDQQVIKAMLEVPYLYTASYDNGSVPIAIASHTAIWMAERSGLSPSTYASGTVVLDLFKYYGQTVVNFKSKCNGEGKCDNIVYNNSTDTFTISAFEDKTHEVTLESFEFLGGNNFYKVTGSVSGAKGVKKVTAIIQKNRLDNSLGFSIKALEWK